MVSVEIIWNYTEFDAIHVLTPIREATAWFNRVGGEGRQFDMLADVPNIQCPTLVLGGQLDPMLPIECQRDIANALDPKLLNYREFEDCGHGVIPDVPELAIPLLRDFIKNQHASR
jgi:proline iminopeptidase